MPELDILRGLAILAVVCFHGLYWRGAAARAHGVGKIFAQATVVGWLGVNLFFVLSGFLITGILIDSRNSPHYYRHFYTRRALRILPAYLLTIVLCVAVGYMRWKGVLLCLLFIANFVFKFRYVGFRTLWSLSVEEQFYLVWPAVVRRVGNRTLATISLAIFFCDPVLRWLSVTGRIPPMYLRTNTLLIADNLACGALVALLVRSRFGTLSIGRRAGWALIAVGILTEAAGYPFGITHRNSILGGTFQSTPWNLFFTGLLLLMLATRSINFAAAWGSPLRFLGYISYGLYLYHLFAFDGCDYLLAHMHSPLAHALLASVYPRFALELAFAILVSWISRKYFEDRFLKIKSTPTRA